MTATDSTCATCRIHLYFSQIYSISLRARKSISFKIYRVRNFIYSLGIIYSKLIFMILNILKIIQHEKSINAPTAKISFIYVPLSLLLLMISITTPTRAINPKTASIAESAELIILITAVS